MTPATTTRALLRTCVAGLLLSLGACRTTPVPPPPADVPASIVSPTPESRAALARAVSAAMSGAPVTLADDALTSSSTLVVERVQPRDPSGRPFGGRELSLPERFRLVKRGDACLLVHEGSGRELVLEDTRCAPP